MNNSELRFRTAGRHPIYESRRIKRVRRTRSELKDVRDAVYEILELDHPQTVRQLFYQATVRGVIEKTEQAYKGTIVRLLGLMRRSGELPYEWITDNTRWMRKPRTYSSLGQALETTKQTYRRALWDNQAGYVEIWCEKDALAGVLMEETEPWDVPLMISRGFSSLTYLYEAASVIGQVGKPAYLYYIGDGDPSGVHIDRAIERELRRLAPAAEIYFERIAVTETQIEQMQLPSRPTKHTDSRSKGFSGESVEVDAIAASTLRGLVEERITRHLDADEYYRMRKIEVLERATLQRVIDGFIRGQESSENDKGQAP